MGQTAEHCNDLSGTRDKGDDEVHAVLRSLTAATGTGTATATGTATDASTVTATNAAIDVATSAAIDVATLTAIVCCCHYATATACRRNYATATVVCCCRCYCDCAYNWCNQGWWCELDGWLVGWLRNGWQARVCAVCCCYCQ